MPRKYSRLLVIILLFWVLAGINQAVSAESGESCLDCHQYDWEVGMSKRFVHLPFQDQQCQICHVDSPTDAEKRQRVIQERRLVKWIDRNFVPAQTHWFRFYAPKGRGTLFIEAAANRGKILQRKMVLPELDDLPRYDNDHVAPKISNVRVIEVRRGLSLAAVISWQTDKATNSMVNYGIKKMNFASPLESSFATHHQVTLAGLEAKKTYQFKVVSEDFFGNQATSDVFSLSTRKTFSLAEEQPSTAEFARKEIEINTEIFQSNELHLVKITANQPVKLSLGSLPSSEQKITYIKSVNSVQATKHVLTNDDFHLNIAICYGCHQQFRETRSHPVNVYPKKGMIIPPEYSTLPDGRMTCMSCHDGHGSNVEYRLIKSSKQELCVGCHKDM